MQELLTRVRACRLCADVLEPRPVLRVSPSSRILVVGQAPGSKVHASGKPWDDASGAHLLEWLQVDRETFDDPDQFGILPMGLCYPGRGPSADNPPDPRCAPTWHASLLQAMPEVRVTLLIGTHAQAAVLGARRERTLTETVRQHERYLPTHLPLPHPSWRSRTWMKRNPWFEASVLPTLRKVVERVLSTPLADG